MDTFKLFICLAVFINSSFAEDFECLKGSCQTTIHDLKTLKNKCDYEKITVTNLTESKIPLGSFIECIKTKVLTISHNNLKRIQVGTFLGMDILTELYLEDNKIEVLEPGTFHNLLQLTVLFITRNLITSIDEYEFTYKRVNYFNMNNNMLKILDEMTLQNLRDVELVDLSSNLLEEIHPKALVNLQPGVTLNLSNNKLKNVSLIIIQSAVIRKSSIVQLTGNNLIALENDTLGMLYVLHVNVLDISYNQINHIEPGFFMNYTSIKKLFLNHNRLEYISKVTLYGFKYLEELDLSNNLLKAEIFELILPKKIKIINYANNKINEIPGYEWLVNQKLENVYLNVDNNNISFIDLNRFSSRIVQISLHNNNFKCSVLNHIIKVLSTRSIKVSNGKNRIGDNINGISCMDSFNISSGK